MKFIHKEFNKPKFEKIQTNLFCNLISKRSIKKFFKINCSVGTKKGILNSRKF